MRRLSVIVIGIMLVGSLFWLASQLSDTPDAPPHSVGSLATVPHETEDVSRDSSDVVPIWTKWPKPEAVLMISGEQHGFFEPCGCTSSQMGGMARRADLLKRLNDVDWDVRGIDLGGLPRRTVRQAQIKFETSLKALRDLRYVAVGLGPEDLRLQPDFLLSQIDPDDASDEVRFVSANLVFYDSPELGIPVPSRIVEFGGRRVGITSVLSESTNAATFTEGTNTGITWSDPNAAIEKVLQDFEIQQVDFRILLSHSSPNESRKLAADHPHFDVIVMAQGFSDPDPVAEPEQVGDTLLLQVGHKGKYVGVLGLYSGEDEPSLRYQLVPLTRSEFADTPQMVDHMRDYQQWLQYEQVAVQDGVIGHPTGASFTGAAKCGECHTDAMKIWEKTPHAHAFESLDPANEREGYERLNGVPRIHDPECLSCHVTGWNPQEYIRYRSGFLNKEFAQTEEDSALQVMLAGNQCENCHGPGSRHVELAEADELDLARKEVKVSLEQAKAICYGCHDTDNSPDFDFEQYWPEVSHYGMD